MNFEEWYRKIKPSVVSPGIFTPEKDSAWKAWDYQQEKIQKLEQALAVLREANDYYSHHYGGKKAREAELKVKEILGEKTVLD